MQMVSQSWQNCLQGPQHKIVPRDGVFVYFLPQAMISQKFFAQGQGIWLPKKFPGGQPGWGDVGAWNWLMHNS